MADEDEADRPDMDWHVRLDRVERLDREEGDEGEVFFVVQLGLPGPGVSGEVSAMVVDPASEATIAAEAVDMVMTGLEEFGAALRLRVKLGPAEPQDRTSRRHAPSTLPDYLGG